MGQDMSWEPDLSYREAPPLERTVFQVERWGAASIVRMEPAQQYMDAATDAVCVRVVGYAARRLLERVEVSWPADWWEAVKERWFPAWALARWPVRYERRRLEASEWLHRRFLSQDQSAVRVEVAKPRDVGMDYL